MADFFPDKAYARIQDFTLDYQKRIGQALASLSGDAMAQAADLLAQALEADAQIFVCGNGGSATIANHFLCDHAKGLQADTCLRPRVRSLSADLGLITAIGNDMSYADIFLFQIATFGRPGDVLVSISSSGDSENVVRAVQWANENGLSTIAMTGFSGGRTARMAKVALHVDAHNYGIVEDVHQSLMHILAQYLRQIRMPEPLISDRRF